MKKRIFQLILCFTKIFRNKICQSFIFLLDFDSSKDTLSRLVVRTKIVKPSACLLPKRYYLECNIVTRSAYSEKLTFFKYYPNESFYSGWYRTAVFAIPTRYQKQIFIFIVEHRHLAKYWIYRIKVSMLLERHPETIQSTFI